MYTLALDEYGQFEKRNQIDAVNKASSGPVFIGGVIFDDNNDLNEASTERKRIDAYYQAVVDTAQKQNPKFSFRYPQSLHVGKDSGNETVAVIKRIVSNSLGEFLCKGTFNGKKLENRGTEFEPRQGKYYLYTILKGEHGKIDALDTQYDKYLNDDWASNRYFHMVDEVLERCIFNTSFAEKESVFCAELATRTTPILPRNSTEANEYRQLHYPESKENIGYDKIEKKQVRTELKCGDEPGSIFTLTDANIYRTIISHKLTDENPDSIKIKKIEVEQMKYNADGINKRQQFLYLADSVCSLLSFGLEKDGENENEWLAEIDRRMGILLPKSQGLLYVYDVIDTKYGEALRAYRSGLYKKALEIMIECSKKDDYTAQFYNRKWLSDLKNRIIYDESRTGIANFKCAVRDIYYSQLSNNYSVDVGWEIYKTLEETAENLKPKLRSDEDKRYLYMLYESGMIASCHMGDSEKAYGFYKKAEQYAYCVSTEEFLRTRNVLVNCYTDYRIYNKALIMAKEDIEAARAIKKVMRAIPQQSNNHFLLTEAKAYSQLGQVYSFMRKVKPAEKYFEAALMNYQTRSADYYITLSYLLHMYLDNQKKDAFFKYADSYFGREKTWEGKLDFIFEMLVDDNPIVSGVFGLFLYVKALYYFGPEKIPDEIWSKLDSIEEYMQQKPNKSSWRMSNHPFELIAKYLCLFAIARDDDMAVNKYLKVLREFTEKKDDADSAVKTIAQMGIAKVAREKGDMKLYEETVCDLYEFFEKRFPKDFSRFLHKRTAQEKADAVAKYFYYMYN